VCSSDLRNSSGVLGLSYAVPLTGANQYLAVSIQGSYMNSRLDLTNATFPDQFDRMARVSREIGARMTRDGETRIFLDELREGTGDYQTEPEIQCGLFCEMAQQEYGKKQESFL
jgi:outer membrane receptor for ferric coprogen and ferric-rhodotorulic acid